MDNLVYVKATLTAALEQRVSRLVRCGDEDPKQYSDDLRAASSHILALQILDKWGEDERLGSKS